MDRVKKNQLEAQLILSTFCQPQHVSGISRPIISSMLPMYKGPHRTTITSFPHTLSETSYPDI